MSLKDLDGYSQIHFEELPTRIQDKQDSKLLVEAIQGSNKSA